MPKRKSVTAPVTLSSTRKAPEFALLACWACAVVAAINRHAKINDFMLRAFRLQIEKDSLLESVRAQSVEVESAKAEAEEAKLREKGEYGVLLKQREERLKQLEEELASKENEIGSYKGAMTNFKKAAAFERELGGKLKKDSYWDHVDFDQIALNPEDGKIDSHSLSKVANAFAEEYKELIDYGKVGNLPNGTASSAGRLTYEQWQKLPLDEQRKRMKDVG